MRFVTEMKWYRTLNGRQYFFLAHQHHILRDGKIYQTVKVWRVSDRYLWMNSRPLRFFERFVEVNSDGDGVQSTGMGF